MSFRTLLALAATCHLAITLNAAPRPEENAPPVITGMAGPTALPARHEIATYTVMASDRDTKDVLVYEWTLSNGDSFVTSEPKLSYTWPAGGSYTVRVLVDDQEDHRVASMPYEVVVSDPLAEYVDGSVQENAALDDDFNFCRYVGNRFFLGAREATSQGQLYWSWDGVLWEGPVLERANLAIEEIVWDGKQFVLVGMEWDDDLSALTGTVYASPDGRAWSRVHREKSGQPYRCFAYDGSRYLIGMSGGGVLSSTDLTTWAETSLPATSTHGVPGDCHEIVVLEGHLCLLTDLALYQLDETGSWLVMREFFQPRREMIAAGDGKVLVAGAGPKIWSSVDGVTWAEEFLYTPDAAPVMAPGAIVELIDAGGTLFARFRPDGGEKPDQWHVRSADTGRWALVHGLNLPNGGTAAFGSGRLVAGQGPDGLTKISGHLYPTNNAPSGSLNGATEIAARTPTAHSITVNDLDGDGLSHWWDLGDGTPWRPGRVVELSWLSGGFYTLTHHMSDGRGGIAKLAHEIFIDDPLDRWRQVESQTKQTLFAVTRSESQVLAVGNQSTVVRSPDGEAWTISKVNESNMSLRGVEFENAHYVVVGGADDRGRIFRSPDGLSWTTVWSSEEVGTELRDVKVAGDVGVAVGRSGLLLRSANGGASWATVDHGLTVETLQHVAHGAGSFVVSFRSGVLVSSDGLSWTAEQTSSEGWNHLHWVHDRFLSSGWLQSEGLRGSPDGHVWNHAEFVPEQLYELPAITQVTGVIVATGNYYRGDHQIAVSLDGQRWR